MDNKITAIHQPAFLMAAGLAALALFSCFFACTRTDYKSAGPAEKVTIAYSATTDAVLAEVAHTLGYYREESGRFMEATMKQTVLTIDDDQAEVLTTKRVLLKITGPILEKPDRNVRC